MITARTRAIVVVTPGNRGATVPPELIAALTEVAARHDVALILDETYRSFRDTEEPPHALFAEPEWARTVVSLHSSPRTSPPRGTGWAPSSPPRSWAGR